MMMTMKMMTTFTHAARNKYGLRCNKYTQYIYIYIYIYRKKAEFFRVVSARENP